MKWLFVSAFNNINNDNDRLLSIINYLEGEKIVLTTDFNHGKKSYYNLDEGKSDIQVFLHVPAYASNLSLKRVWSHIVFARQVKRYFNSLREFPDVVYCAMPTSSSAYVCAKYCKKLGIKFIIDIIDLWPDSLLPLIKCKTIIKFLLYPWFYLTRYSYGQADIIIGESVAYAKEAKRFNDKAKIYPLYLGVDVDYIRKIKENKKVYLNKPNDELWIGYAGSLGESYDFDTLLCAIKSIHGQYNYKLWFIGDGVKRQEIELYIKENDLNVEITGYLPYEQLLGYLSYCDIAINIFRDKTKVVHSYKFNDYVAMDCFVLNSLEGETADMIEEYKVGRNFGFKDDKLSDILKDTLENWDIYSLWRKNAKVLVDEKLNKRKIYHDVMDTIVKEINF